MVFLGDTRSAEELAVYINMAPERLCLGCGLRVEEKFTPISLGSSVAFGSSLGSSCPSGSNAHSEFSSGLVAVDLIHLFLARCLLLAGNCLPYHQPEFLQIKIPGKHWGFLALFVWHLDSTYSVENSLGYQRSGFFGWYFLRLLSKVFPGSRESSLAQWIRDLWVIFTGTWILLTLVENSLGFLRSGFSGWNFLRFGA